MNSAETFQYSEISGSLKPFDLTRLGASDDREAAASCSKTDTVKHFYSLIMHVIGR